MSISTVQTVNADASYQVRVNHSLLIRAPKVLNEIQISHDMGEKLGELAEYLIELQNKRRAKAGPSKIEPEKQPNVGERVSDTFRFALNEQREHNNFGGQKLGRDISRYRDLEKVFRLWNYPAKLSAIDTPQELRGGPFRLLAVVNRIDRAGDMDDRGNMLAVAQPRALGEVHLVYGLVDETYEEAFHSAFPMTFSLAYRLPPIKLLKGEHVADHTTSQASLINSINTEKWKDQISWWAQRWSGLSNHNVNSIQFNEKLNQILDLAATPDNFLAMRTNTEVHASSDGKEREHELRSFYIRPAAGDDPYPHLIPLKPRNEPYRCTSNSELLSSLVNHYWKNQDNDLNMRDRNPSQRFKGQNGFSVPRDDLAFYDATITPSLPDLFGDCGARWSDDEPFKLFEDKNTINKGDRMVFIAPFARADRYWKWEIRDSEPKRHAFAIRTCSGCHGQEGLPIRRVGFHIAPRLKGRASAISPFLSGKFGNGNRATYRSNGHTYRYHELWNRKQIMQKFAERSANLFDSLVRKDRRYH